MVLRCCLGLTQAIADSCSQEHRESICLALYISVRLTSPIIILQYGRQGFGEAGNILAVSSVYSSASGIVVTLRKESETL